MPDRVTTSFIPKESLTSERGPVSPRKNPFVFLNIIAGGIIVLAILAAGGIFLLKTYTESSIASKRDSLEKQRAAFEPATIEELLRLDKRLTASAGLLRGHVALSLLFDDLESRTMENVRFKSFTYEQGAGNKFAISMGGIAKSFNSVALQSDAFGKSNIIKDPIFENLNIDQTGDVIFDFTAEVDPARISYATVVAAAGAAPVPPSTDSGSLVPEEPSTQP